jgi:hypothetical protein
LYFPLPVWYCSIARDPIEPGNPQNIRFAVETAFLTGCKLRYK